MRSLLTLSLLAAVAGCVAPPPPAREPPTRPRPAPPPPPPAPAPVSADWRDWPLTPGGWAYSRDPRGSRALFGTTGVDALVVLRCDIGDRRLYLSRAGAATGPLTIRTSSTTRAVAVQPTGATPPYAAVALAPDDSLLDAIAFSRGKVAIEQPGAPRLALPAWAEIGRVVEDCRG